MRRSVGVAFAAVLAAVVCTVPAATSAAPGDLDPTFGGDGKVVTVVSVGPFRGGSAVEDIAQDAAGRLVVAGEVAYDDSPVVDVLVARYLPDGTLDGSFGGDGVVTTDFGADEEGAAIAVQGDGKLVLAGSSCGTAGCDLLVVRYLPDGSLDASFGEGGRVLIDNGLNDFGRGVAVQPDGKIVVAGLAATADRADDVLLVRLLPDGRRDDAFGRAGVVLADHPAGGTREHAADLELYPDGTIVIAGGHTPHAGATQFAVARFHAGGAVDDRFGERGWATTAFPGPATAVGLELDPEGRIVVLGNEFPTAGAFPVKWALARYTPNGALDPTFGSGGKLSSVPFGVAGDVAVQPDGKIVAFGGGYTVVRYLPDGVLDPSFATDGVASADFSSDDSIGGPTFAGILQRDGKPVVGGYVTDGSSSDARLALARFLADDVAPPPPVCFGRPATVWGGEGADSLVGTPGDDVMHGLGGADRLEGGGGNDLICGGGGDDLLAGGAGDDALGGGAGSDTAVYLQAPGPVSVDLAAGSATGDGTDRLAGINNLVGSAFADVLRGDGQANELAGAAGDDRLHGAGGDDRLSGGAGDDQLDGGAGHDQALYVSAPGPITASLLSGTARGHGADTLLAIEGLHGSPHADTLTGDQQPNLLAAGDGDDTLRGAGGADRIHAGAGHDQAHGQAGDDHLHGGPGDDRLHGGAHTDTIDGSTGTDTCTSGETLANCE